MVKLQRLPKLDATDSLSKAVVVKTIKVEMISYIHMIYTVSCSQIGNSTTIVVIKKEIARCCKYKEPNEAN